MRIHVRHALACAAAATVLVVVWLAVVPAAGQAAAYRARRTADGKPDLNGIWEALNSANWDIQAHPAQPSPFPQLLGAIGAAPAGQGIVEGNEIPYQPWALAKKKENFEKRAVIDVLNDEKRYDTGDPEITCYMPGVPRATYMPFPFQIVQGTGPYILIAYEYASTIRTIRMNFKEEAPTDSWMGWSRGRWEGDTLVVDVSGFNGYTWFDRAGNFHSDALHVVERYTPMSPYHMMYEATIEDPKVFTRPWKISLPLYRRMDKGVQLVEYKCVPYTEELMFGKLRKVPRR